MEEAGRWWRRSEQEEEEQEEEEEEEVVVVLVLVLVLGVYAHTTPLTLGCLARREVIAFMRMLGWPSESVVVVDFAKSLKGSQL